VTDDDAPQIALGLRRIRPPEHHPDFWSELDRRLADEPQLRLAPRAAIRPITQPPPVIDDSKLAGRLKGDTPPPRSSRRRTLVVVAAVVLVGALIAVAALQEPDDATTDTGTGATSETTAQDAAPADEASAGTAGAAAPPTTAPGTIDPAAQLTPGGVGPLTIGARLADLQAAGVLMQVDTATFEASGGTCYDAKVPGALDLTLRFRAPDGQSRANDPIEGVLASVTIESGLPTMRTTDSGLGLGAPQGQVPAVYGGNIEERSHPTEAAGRIYRAAAAHGKGLAYFTDGQVVNRISVGEMETIRFLHQCR
jgi:hypothetical protein